jgi:hypothetical protein
MDGGENMVMYWCIKHDRWVSHKEANRRCHGCINLGERDDISAPPFFQLYELDFAGLEKWVVWIDLVQ